MTSERSKPAGNRTRAAPSATRDGDDDPRLPSWARSDPPPAATSYIPRAVPRTLYCEIDGLPVELELSELSIAGLFVNSTTTPAEGADVDVFLRIEETSWSTSGHVVQVVSCERAAEEGRRPGFALLFTNVPEAQRQKLREAISSLRKQRVASTPPTAAHVPSAPAATAVKPEAPAAPKPTAAQPGREALAVLSKLRAELRLLEHKPAWGVLGIPQSSDPAGAKAAFFEASKRYHPHLYSRYDSPEITKLVTELFIAHKRAYDMMLKAATVQAPGPSDRAAPAPRAGLEDREPTAAGAPLEVPTSDPPQGARTISNKPLQTASVRPPVTASSTPLPEKKSRTVEAELLVRGALKHVAANRLADADNELRKALDLDPQCVNARIWSLVLQARGLRAGSDPAGAYAKYLEVLTLDGRHHEALIETKKLAKDLREKQPGLLGKLFGAGNK